MQFVQIHFAICTNKFCDSSQSRDVHESLFNITPLWLDSTLLSSRPFILIGMMINYIKLCIDMCIAQHRAGCLFIIEQPAYATSWDLDEMEEFKSDLMITLFTKDLDLCLTIAHHN